MYVIKFIEKEERGMILPLLQRLNTKISRKTLETRLGEMFLNGYKCIGVYDKDKLVGISGIWVLTKYYIGKHIEPDNVFILPEYQGKGIGKLLMRWIFNYAQEIGCEASALNCYVKNKAGQRFWKNQGYEIVAYHFQKQF